MKVNDVQDFFTESIARKVAIKFNKQYKPLLIVKSLAMVAGLYDDVHKSKRWLNIKSDETSKNKIAISVTYSNAYGDGRYYVFYSIANSTYVSGCKIAENADTMYLEVLSLFEQAGEDVYNTFVTEL